MRIVSLRRVATFTVLMTLIGIWICFPPGKVAAEERRTISAPDLIQMMGVNVHMRYTDGAYNNLRNVLQALRSLGSRTSATKCLALALRPTCKRVMR